MQAEILNLLSRLRQSYSLTSILVSHDLAVVAHLCNRIAIMQLGRLVEVVSAEDLRSGAVRRGLYARTHRRQPRLHPRR